MDEKLTWILEQHRKRYPQMQWQDTVKLIYQHVMGAGHMIDSPSIALQHLQQEMAGLPVKSVFPDKKDYEPIGNERVRLYLSTVRRMGYSPDLINRLFVDGAGAPTAADHNVLRELIADLPPQPEIAAYLASGCPPVHHSDQYRLAYRPAYRVIPAVYARILPLLAAIDEAPKPVVVAIDGMCGSGKTSVAALMARIFGARVIHTDDFYLPKSERTPERMAIPGWNLDIPRFRREVLEPIARCEKIRYSIYDPHLDGMAGTRELPPADVTVIEGSYSLHPELIQAYDLTVYLAVSPDTQVDRILERNGADWLVMFQNQWIPAENVYAEHFRIAQNARFFFKNEEKLSL
ncbi:MAG: hypothetical protein IJM90_04310 [Firmicutes bacterium]|nr:hypothetical protein [Bacillota bacterium]